MFILFDTNDINKLSRIKDTYLTRVQNESNPIYTKSAKKPKNFLLSN